MPASRPLLPPAGAHGGDGVAVARALGMDPAALLDLSQNMNPVAPPLAPLVVSARIRIKGIVLWARGLPIMPRPSDPQQHSPSAPPKPAPRQRGNTR